MNFKPGHEWHCQIDWPNTHRALGIPEAFLALKNGKRGKNGPCPICAGSDRYFYDNKDGRGTFFCNKCGAGDGFDLLMRFRKWSFVETLSQVLKANSIDTETPAKLPIARPSTATQGGSGLVAAG